MVRAGNDIIGRDSEQKILKQHLESKRAEFLALYGRRRVGKTYLIRNYFSKSNCIFFHATGMQNGSLIEQLEQFSKQIGITFYGGAEIVARKRWLDAFEDITKAMQQVAPQKKIVLFFDELPWMATKRSGVLKALEYYWNRYWGQDSRIKLIICGSSASWVIDKIINNKAGLYNRVTRTMRLDPFTLYETKAFLKNSGIKLSEQQTLSLYMILGGIPHYLSFIKRGQSAHQCIDELFFQKDGALVNEFDRLFASLFQDSEIYISLVQAIAQHRYGIGQAQLIHEVGLPEGGRLVNRLKELEEAGFVSSFLPYGHREKGIFYKIIDEFTLFYLHWVTPRLIAIRKQATAHGYWLSKTQSPSWKSWAGYSFEAVCAKHLPQIQRALKIAAGAEIGSWRYVPKSEKEKGVQIDLLFDRPDDSITICEIKYTTQPFAIDKAYATILQNKIEVFCQQTRMGKQIFFAMITNSGLKQSKYSEDIVNQQSRLRYFI